MSLLGHWSVSSLTPPGSCRERLTRQVPFRGIFLAPTLGRTKGERWPWRARSQVAQVEFLFFVAGSLEINIWWGIKYAEK